MVYTISGSTPEVLSKWMKVNIYFNINGNTTHKFDLIRLEGKTDGTQISQLHRFCKQ